VKESRSAVLELSNAALYTTPTRWVPAIVRHWLSAQEAEGEEQLGVEPQGSSTLIAW